MPIENSLVLEVKKFKAGYEVRTELHRIDFEAIILSAGKNPHDAKDIAEYINQNKGNTIIVKLAYTPSGDYIGDTKTANFLCVKKGIKPEKADSDHKTCSIGFCEKEQKWYGWSHRAIYGFGVGDKVAKGDCCASSGWSKKYLKEHPEKDLSLPVGFEAKDLKDAKRMAIAFAESVG